MAYQGSLGGAICPVSAHALWTKYALPSDGRKLIHQKQLPLGGCNVAPDAWEALQVAIS